MQEIKQLLRLFTTFIAIISSALLALSISASAEEPDMTVLDVIEGHNALYNSRSGPFLAALLRDGAAQGISGYFILVRDPATPLIPRYAVNISTETGEIISVWVAHSEHHQLLWRLVWGAESERLTSQLDLFDAHLQPVLDQNMRLLPNGIIEIDQTELTAWEESLRAVDPDPHNDFDPTGSNLYSHLEHMGVSTNGRTRYGLLGMGHAFHDLNLTARYMLMDLGLSDGKNLSVYPLLDYLLPDKWGGGKISRASAESRAVFGLGSTKSLAAEGAVLQHGRNWQAIASMATAGGQGVLASYLGRSALLPSVSQGLGAEAGLTAACNLSDEYVDPTGMTGSVLGLGAPVAVGAIARAVPGVRTRAHYQSPLKSESRYASLGLSGSVSHKGGGRIKVDLKRNLLHVITSKGRRFTFEGAYQLNDQLGKLKRPLAFLAQRGKVDDGSALDIPLTAFVLHKRGVTTTFPEGELGLYVARHRIPARVLAVPGEIGGDQILRTLAHEAYGSIPFGGKYLGHHLQCTTGQGMSEWESFKAEADFARRLDIPLPFALSFDTGILRVIAQSYTNQPEMVADAFMKARKAGLPQSSLDFVWSELGDETQRKVAEIISQVTEQPAIPPAAVKSLIQ